jgi:carbon storage regulator
MLVLGREIDQSVMIGDSIKVTVVDVRGDKVRLGIDAPEEISVDREEIYEKKKAELKREADEANM